MYFIDFFLNVNIKDVVILTPGYLAIKEDYDFSEYKCLETT